MACYVAGGSTCNSRRPPRGYFMTRPAYSTLSLVYHFRKLGTVLHCTVRHCTVLYRTVESMPHHHWRADLPAATYLNHSATVSSFKFHTLFGENESSSFFFWGSDIMCVWRHRSDGSCSVNRGRMPAELFDGEGSQTDSYGFLYIGLDTFRTQNAYLHG